MQQPLLEATVLVLLGAPGGGRLREQMVAPAWREAGITPVLVTDPAEPWGQAPPPEILIVGPDVGYGEGFLMRVAAERCAIARQRPALENLPRRKPRGSWIILWGKCAEGWSNGFIRGAAEGAHSA
jgi:hypothetical protein